MISMQKFLAVVVACFLFSFARACEFDIWVFDNLEHCAAANETGTIIADGECRSEGLNSAYTFPGYYRATCSGEGIRFLVSGCSDATCQQCEPDGTVGATLYQVASNPLAVQMPLDIIPSNGREYRCYSLSSNRGVSIYFAFFGVCSQCPVPATPTFAPIVAPTPFPTRAPISARPTFAPISRRPTRAPITQRPTWAPISARPTPVPTSYPTFSTNSPITDAPTASPTRNPTRTPVEMPVTPYPTQNPTERPTASPTRREINIVPVKRPTAAPSSRPTSSPTTTLTSGGEAAPVVASDATAAPQGNAPKTVTMRIAPPLGDLIEAELAAALVAWEQVTSDHVSRAAGPTQVQNAYIVDATSVEAIAIARLSGADPEQLWAQAFDSPQEQEEYLDALRASHPVFAGTDSISLERKATGINAIGYILGIVGAVAALFFICVTLVAVRSMRRPRKPKSKKNRNEKVNRVRANEPPVEYTNDIVLLERSPSDGISTLGGYTNTQKDDINTVWDDPTVSVNIDYDFERNEYKDAGQNDKSLASGSVDFSNASALQRLGDTLFSDDKSFEQQFVENRVVPRNPRIEPFEVIVPPGLLGMVVDSAVAGLPPVVQAIRPESILTEKVRIGDRLLSVDQHDVTNMTARAVSNVISQRANQQRVFVFARVDD